MWASLGQRDKPRSRRWPTIRSRLYVSRRSCTPILLQSSGRIGSRNGLIGRRCFRHLLRPVSDCFPSRIVGGAPGSAEAGVRGEGLAPRRAGRAGRTRYLRQSLRRSHRFFRADDDGTCVYRSSGKNAYMLNSLRSMSSLIGASHCVLDFPRPGPPLTCLAL